MPQHVTASQVAAQIDVATRRVLALKARFGLLDPPQETDRHAEGIRLEAARESARIASRDLAARSLVLLADDDLTLPPDPHRLRRIALAGPYANDVPRM